MNDETILNGKKRTWDEIWEEKLQKMIEGNERLASLPGNKVNPTTT